MFKRSYLLAALVVAVLGVFALGGCASQVPAPTQDSGSVGQQTQPAQEPAPATSEAPAPTTPPATKLVIKDEMVGSGVAAKAGDKVVVNYTGWLTNGTKFDSSIGKAPFPFTLGAGQVIPGWDQGVAGMKVGGKRKLTIPPDLGYGAQGTPDGTIPPNSTLVFEVELLKIN